MVRKSSTTPSADPYGREMKSILPFCLGFAFAGGALAEIRIPSSVHTLAEIEEAKAEAIKEKKPLVFVVTDPGST